MLAYGYCRYSSDMQNDKSIEQQKLELEEYALKNNIVIKKYYIDEACSGRYDTRASFQEMINDACKLKEVKAILVWKTDRFARKAMDNLYYRAKLEKCGVSLISITQPFDAETAEGKLMTTLLAGMDEYFSQNLASNVKRALKNNALNNEFNGGIAPLGYDIVDKKYVVNEQEAKIVREIFQLYVDGLSYIKIAIQLNAKGYRTKKGKPFAKTSVMSILTNEKYTGKYIFNKGTKSNHKGTREDAIIRENALPVIIDNDLWEKAINRRNYKPHAENKAKNFYLLSGLINCSCGGTYTGYTSTKTKNGNTYKYGYYKCNHRNKLDNCTMPFLMQNKLENYIINLLTKKLFEKENMKKLAREIINQLQNMQNESVEDVEEIKNKIKEYQKQIDNIVDMICKGIASDALASKITELEFNKKQLEEELNFKSSVCSINIDENKIIELLKKDINQIDKTSKEDLKNLIKKWVKKIEVTNDFIDVYFYSEVFLPHQVVARTRYCPYSRIINNFTSDKQEKRAA